MDLENSPIWDGDYLIIGAGAAGLQLAYFLQQSGDDYLILERAGKAGMFWDKFPRHRKMISINKVNNGYTDRDALMRWDWNSLICDDDSIRFPNYTHRYYPDAGLYQQYLDDFARHFVLNIRFNVQVERIAKPGERFEVRDTQGNLYRCRRLIVATGVTKPYIPEIPGIEHTENYTDFSFVPEDYTGQTVLLIGKGTSAFEVANHLIETTRVIHMCSPESIRLAWATHFIGHLRAINTEFLDTYLLKGQNSILDAWIENIEYKDNEYIVQVRFPNADNQRMVAAYDRVISCTGFRFDTDIFSPECCPETTCNGRLPAMSTSWEATNVKDLYFAGTLMQVLDYQKTHSNVIHGFRFNIRAMSWMFGEKYHDRPIPCREFTFDESDELAAHIIHRISTDGAMFQQQGFLGDLVVVDREQRGVRYYHGLPVGYVQTTELGCASWYYLLTMEFGHSDQDPFSIVREKDPDKANEDFYLHPMVRRYGCDELHSEYHIPEHLENDWRSDAYPGSRPMIRSLEYIDEEDHSQFQKSYLRNLQAFLRTELAETGC